jgi:monomeric isocitrate dehydrogenase
MVRTTISYGNVLRDYNTDPILILEVGTSAKISSMQNSPTNGGGFLLETGAGGFAPTSSTILNRKITCDGIPEFLALATSLQRNTVTKSSDYRADA